MEADYSVELGAEAPALELPWEDPEGRWNYVELRNGVGAAEPDWERTLKRHIERIPETRQFPTLRRFLLAANSPLSAWQTAKCSVWPDVADPAENDYNASFVHSSYIDLVLADEHAQLRGDLKRHERLAKELAGILGEDGTLPAMAEIVVRRCYFHDSVNADDSEPGYSLTLFLIGYGKSAADASQSLASAMALASEALVKLKAE
jgi:hypothetical protein